jgi:putative heme-binding domain-containing protein
LASIAELAQTRFAENDSFQEQLLRSVHGGLLQRGDGVPTVVSHWAEKIARRYLGMNEDDDSLPATDPLIGWAFVSESKTSAGENPWVVSTSRKSADGRKSTMLHSSFPTGEAKTGIYRSDSFELPAQFSFYLAGHDGVPDHPIQETNFVRIRDAVTQAELKRWSPPRNDTAQPITWHTGESAGHRVFVELVDGDDGPAYAWLAAGRFSVTGLNPNEEWGKRRKAAKLIAEFRLEDLRRPVEQLLLNPQTTPEVAAEFATALIAWKPTSRLSAVAESILIAAVDRSLRSELVDVVLTRSPENLSALLGRVMKLASAAQQKRIAAELSSDHDGIETLLSLVQAGQASARLLLDPAIKDKLDSLATEAQHQRYTDLIIDLPSEDETLVAAMDDRKARYLEKTGDLLEGAGLFTKQCSVCHQVAGKGTAVGPNLDGIGNRGLDRIIEDVLTPNRNIDAAFRASIVLTEDGRVFSGLVKRSEGAQLVIVDQTGKEIKIPSDAIETQKTVLTSPMPANFHETLDEKQIRDLLAYLLSLTHQ